MGEASRISAMRHPGTATAEITSRPAEALIDEVPEIIVAGLPAGSEVRIDATETDANEAQWSSWAVFKASGAGAVTTTASPIAGTYAGADASGLFWSMRPQADGSVYGARSDRIVSVVEASIAGEPVARSEIARVVAASGVRRSEVDADGVRGVLFEPTEPSGASVISVQGSGGGVNESEAALLASHGFTTLALAYFKYPGLPPTLDDIPLEYFESAGKWLLSRPNIRVERCGLIGQSRGGELVLVLAATFPNLFGPVVATAPSSHVWAGMGEGSSAWSLGGTPLKHIDPAEPTPVRDLPPPIALTPLFEAAMRDGTLLGETAIPIERADCPILLLSGEDDKMWPSSDFAERVVARLRQHRYRRPFRHVCFPSAGHTLSGLPNIAVVTHSLHPVAHLDFAYGGTPEGTARARREAWRLRLAFLTQPS